MTTAIPYPEYPQVNGSLALVATLMTMLCSTPFATVWWIIDFFKGSNRKFMITTSGTGHLVESCMINATLLFIYTAGQL